ncbi:MAG: serine/threonine protein kinase [Planctomycetes bacterium]|nr:serine/threonine protein kinase [Planctomycetota bacterium]
MSDTPEPTRREDVAALFAASRLEMSEGLRAQTHEVASRVFGLSETPSGPLEPGELLGAYRIKRLVGVGGQAFVYEAEHTQIGRRVALKVPLADVAERLLNEARLAVKLDHPHIVRVEDVGEAQGPNGTIPFLVMEFLPGGNLAERLALAPEGLPLDEVHAISRALLSALDSAHTNGIVHRDVKPANVLFDADGKAKLSDLGIGKLATSGADLAHSIERSQMTQGAIGTPAFMAPEQENPELLKGEQIDGRADLFSFGKLLFTCLTGASPTTIRPPSRLRPELDERWDELVFRCLEEQRDQRPASALEILAELKALEVAAEPAPVAPPQVYVRPKTKTPDRPAAVVASPTRAQPRAVKSSAGFLVFAGLAAFGLGLAGVLLQSLGATPFAAVLGGYTAFNSLLLAWFANSERRSSVSVGIPGALLLAAPLIAWEPLLAFAQRATHTLDRVGLAHGLGIATIVLGLVLGMALSVRANRQEQIQAIQRPRAHVVTESGWSATCLTCLQLGGCGVLILAIAVLGLVFLAALF